MESLVYEDSPLADYLEGEGERDQDWVPLEVNATANANTPQNFAPKGVPSLQNRARDIFAGKKGSLQEAGTGALDWLHRACSTAISSRIGKRENDRFLEQFGYVIVASHLLDEYNATSHTTAVAKDAAQSNVPVYGTTSLSTAVGLSGSIITAATSFSIVALIHWSRSRTGAGFNPRRIVVLLVVLPLVGAVFCAFARRQWLKFVRHHAVHGASGFVDSSQRFDSLVSSSVLFIQEVELVSRGYRISTPLPPISRLEETAHVRRCMRLRRAVSESLSTVLERYIQAQHTIGLLTDPCNLEKYYDIYELSMEELAEARSASFEPVTEDQYSLKCLRVLFSRLYTVRKSILCCLLAIKADGCGSDIPPWTSAADEMRELATVTGEAANKIASILNEEDRTTAPLTPSASTGRETLRAQARRLNSLSQGIRALHAKMHVMREESDESLTRDTSEPDIDASLMAQYESIGDDIRGLLQEWEAGKSALLSSLEQQQSSSSLTFNRSSRASSSSTNDLKLPLSPTSSLGGVTAVDGSPSAALMALNGETQTLNNFAVVDADAEEIFEAIVMPSSRKRQSLTREERIARVKEDRARQAAAREKTDANTNMLRELETVIKHRPQLRNKPQRITSI